MKLILIIILIDLFSRVFAQKVIFSNKVYSIFVTKRLNRDLVLKNQIDFFIALIEKESLGTKLEIKGISLSDHLRSRQNDWYEKSKYMLSLEPVKDKKVERGIPFLGRLISFVTDIPGPDQFDAHLKITKKLISLTENQNHRLDNAQKSIRINHEELDALIDLAKKQVAITNNITNELETEDKYILLNSKLDIWYVRAQQLLDHAKTELDKRSEILEKASLHLPSKNLFSIAMIKKVLNEHIETDKLFSPVFFTDAEMHELFSFECAITTYDPIKNEFISVMDLPFADYHDSLKTLEIPDLSHSDKNRIHKLETMSRTRINRILCSSKMNSIRLLANENLEKCQRHISRNFYLCSGRKIFMRYDESIDCNLLEKLPKIIVIEKSNNEYFIDNKYEEMNIKCDDVIKNVLKPDIGPIRIKLPENCELNSKSLTISTEKDMKSFKTNITVKSPEITIFPINTQFFEPYRPKHMHEPTILNNRTDLPSNTNYEEDKFVDQLKNVKEQLKSVKNNRSSIIEIASLVLSVFAISMVMIVPIRKFYRFIKQDKKEANESKILLSKYLELEVKIGHLQIEINDCKLRQLSNIENKTG